MKRNTSYLSIEEQIMGSDPAWQRQRLRDQGHTIIEVWYRVIDGVSLHCKERPHFAMPEQWKLIYIVRVKLRSGL